jgi:hypothetical protein
MTATRFFVLCLLCLAAVRAIPAVAAPDIGIVEGQYTYVEAESESIEAAIQASAAKLNFIVRQFARPRLRKTNYAYERLSFTVDGDMLAIRMDARTPIRVPLNGDVVKWQREDGEWFDVSIAWENGVLTQRYAAEDGQRANAFSLSEDRQKLTLQVTVTSPKLKLPVQYRLVYQRRTTGD